MNNYYNSMVKVYEKMADKSDKSIKLYENFGNFASSTYIASNIVPKYKDIEKTSTKLIEKK